MISREIPRKIYNWIMEPDVERSLHNRLYQYTESPSSMPSQGHPELARDIYFQRARIIGKTLLVATTTCSALVGAQQAARYLLGF